MLPRMCSSTRLPALRSTNRSPSPWSKNNSGATRESAHVSTTANGVCPLVSSSRRCSPWCGCSARPATKRWLPSTRRCNDTSGESPAAASPRNTGRARTGRHTRLASLTKLRIAWMLFIMGKREPAPSAPKKQSRADPRQAHAASPDCAFSQSVSARACKIARAFDTSALRARLFSSAMRARSSKLYR